MFQPAMQHVGQINQVGNTYLFGLAQHVVDEDRTDTVYLNLAGPVTSVEAVWAKLAERGTIIARGSDGRGRYLRHGGLGSGETPYLRFQRRVPGLQIEHLILLDRRFGEVEYGDVGVTFLFDAPDMPGKLAEHVRQLVNLPVFAAWAERLAEIGRVARLLRPLGGLGDQTVYLLDLDRTRWEQQIALRVEQNELPWPGDDMPLKPIAPEPEEADDPSSAAPTSEPESTVPAFTVTHERDWSWVAFDGKPGEATRAALKRAGFRWGKRRRAWYATRRVEQDEVESVIQ